MIEDHLRARRDSGSKLLIPYVTGMVRPDWVRIAEAFANAGADALEIGIPFSDPAMDGPIIQRASTTALGLGANPLDIFSAIRDADLGIPLVAMTYANLVHRAGYSRFAAWLADAGFSGAIVPDLPLEESGDWEEAARRAGVAPILLAAPVTPDRRLALICSRTAGFVYAVSAMGVTGSRASLADTAEPLVRRIRAVTDTPVLLGFGISSTETAVEACQAADGVIVASALMERVLAGDGPEQAASLVGEMRTALDRAFAKRT